MIKLLFGKAKQHWKLVSVVALILSLVGCICYLQVKHNRDAKMLTTSLVEARESIVVVQNKHRSVEKELRLSQTEGTELAELVASLKARPETIRTIVRTETKLVSVESEPVVMEELPDSYDFKLQEDLTVASFHRGPPYVFETYDLGFRATLVVTEKKSSALIQVQSEKEGVWVDVPADVEVIQTARPKKFFDPDIVLGGTVALPTFEGGLSVSVPMLHPTKDIDILAPRISLSANPRFGGDAFGYNLGNPIPVIEDLWIYVGASTDIKGTPSVDITLGTKL